LSSFTLPDQLGEISYQDMRSVFSANPICEIQFFDELHIEGKTFVNADFASFSGKEYPIILEKETGQPLHLPGVGHRNELATSWIDHTVINKFHLGDNRMVGVKTIGEDLKEGELLFSIQQVTSWLPFFENYLPVFKQVIEVDDDLVEAWDYHLFELAEVTKDKEYVVVEKHPPYRILADKKSSGYQVKIVKSKNKTIQSPEELNAIKRFFKLGSSVLVEVD